MDGTLGLKTHRPNTLAQEFWWKAKWQHNTNNNTPYKKSTGFLADFQRERKKG